MASVDASPSAFSIGFQLLSALLLLLSLVEAKNQSQEVISLLSFKETFFTTADNYDYHSDYFITWLETDESPCSWIGVTCTDRYTVAELSLSGWGLESVKLLNVSMLSNLRDLQHLDLSSNFLYGLPVGLDNLTGLTQLDLSQNFLSLGYGASIGKLTRLTLLDLSGNFVFVIPLNISSCRSLRSLYLQDNPYLFSDVSSLLGLAELQILLLSGSNFSGAFPSELGQLSKLVTLDLSRNFFSGIIPALPNLTKLVNLQLDNNNFTDFAKSWFLGSNGTLQLLSVSSNQLTGPIPSSIPNLLELRTLNMSGNRLSGTIPLGFSHQKDNSFSLDVSLNQLTGSIPADLLPRSKLNKSCSYFNLSFNLLTGSIPPPQAQLSCIQSLDLSHNNLSGPIPKNLLAVELLDYDGAGLVHFYNDMWLHNNRLSGDIVDVLNEASNRSDGLPSYLKLQHNLFTGDLSKLSLTHVVYSPQVFDISDNDLRWSTSEVNPDPIGSLLMPFSAIGLEEFRAGGNDLSGMYLPTTCFLANGNFLVALDLSNSGLNGEVLDAAFNSSCMPSLQFLNLSNNNFFGSVPQSIVDLPALEILDVSNNKLSGPLPTFPVSGTLNTNPAYYGGNDGLCGYPLGTACAGHSSLQWWVFLVTIGGSLTIVLVTCLGATWRWRVYRKLHQQDADLIRTLLERDAAALMPLRELKRATDNFANSAQIGQGGFGTVYVGKLDDGTMVAIKRSKKEGSDLDKEQFLNEVRVLSHVNHRNLVKLLGCCMENKVAVLVFEFVSNGTLQEHLQGKAGPVRLTWHQRLNIAVQAADALNYLHSAATIPIYHRDVKSANILLNDDLNAKVADFGISRVAPLQATHVSTVAVQGTMGYIDPEYYTSYQLTAKSDVYSFGVVLLELISAKPALDFLRTGEETSLVNFASKYMETGDLEGFLDPALEEKYNDFAGQGRESILSVGRLAMTCTDVRAKGRPSMKEVLKELQGLWLKLTGSSTQFQDTVHLTGSSTQLDTVDLTGSSTQVDAVKVDDDSDGDRDDRIFLAESFSGDSSIFTRQTGASSIEMSPFSRSKSSR